MIRPLASPDMHVLSLRDDLFLLAHDDSGKLLLGEASIGAGLAGATLIDLLLSRRVGVIDGRLSVLEPAVSLLAGPLGQPSAPAGAAEPADEEATATMDAIAANTAPCGPRAWVSWISHGAYARAAEALSAIGVIQRVTARRLGLLPVTRCLPANSEDLVRVRAKVRYAIHARDLPDPYTAALCGLIRVLRLESSLLLSMPASDLLLALERMTAADDVTVRQVTNAVDAVITTATYR